MADIQGVYWILNKVDGTVYVGSSVHVPDRWKRHRKALKEGTHGNAHLQAAWNKYGEEEFEFEVIEVVSDRLWLRARETAWMYRLRANKRGLGYNITGDGFCPMHAHLSEEHKRKISDAHRGRKWGRDFREKARNAAKKRAATEDFKRDIVKRRIGKTHSEATRLKMREAWVRRRARGLVHWAQGKTVSAETREKMQRRYEDPEERRKHSERMKQAWAERKARSCAERKIIPA